MLQVEYRLKLGQDEFVLKAEVKDEREFFEKMSFYASLPRQAPGGATDLKLSFRTTTQGYKYYSLVSESENMEYKFGQENSKDGGLFPKGWQTRYQGDNEEQDVSQAPAARPQARQAAPSAAPARTRAAAPTINQPAQAASPMPTPMAMPATQEQTQAAAAPAANPKVSATANNVLARFGINK